MLAPANDASLAERNENPLRALPAVEIDVAVCCACRMCEVACSFHLIGAYSPADAAVRIGYDARTGVVTALVSSACDGCVGESEGPACIVFCPLKAVRRTRQRVAGAGCETRRGPKTSGPKRRSDDEPSGWRVDRADAGRPPGDRRNADAG